MEPTPARTLAHDSPQLLDAGRRSIGRAARCAVAAAGVVALCASAARANTIYVANTGSDGPGCGAQSSPCRTISQGIVVAAAGDQVLVLPGVYGDVDGDGEFVTPGDEPAQGSDGCNCLVHVDKPVTIQSQAGAGATVLRGADGMYAVNITAPGVVLGKKKKGFSIVGDPQGDAFGVRVDDSATDTRIEGNQFSRLAQGMFIAGDRTVVTGNRISQVTVQGIHAEGAGMQIVANVVEQTGTLGANSSAIHVVGKRSGAHKIDRNLVVANPGIGIYVDDGWGASIGSPHLVSNNLVVGNGAAGVKVVLAVESGGVSITGNSIYNNDNVAGTNCGLMTFSAGSVVITATNNYWGGPGGPGADPKDDVCSLGTPPAVSPAAGVEFAIVAPPMR